METHYIVVKDYTSTYGVERKVGDYIVIGDATPKAVIDEVNWQLAMGNLREVEQGAGVATPAQKKEN